MAENQTQNITDSDGGHLRKAVERLGRTTLNPTHPGPDSPTSYDIGMSIAHAAISIAQDVRGIRKLLAERKGTST